MNAKKQQQKQSQTHGLASKGDVATFTANNNKHHGKMCTFVNFFLSVGNQRERTFISQIVVKFPNQKRITAFNNFTN